MIPEAQRNLIDRLNSVFFSYAKNRLSKLMQDGHRLVHYTSAENAISIIQNKTLWLRDTRSMSDFAEVEHGYAMLLNYFQQIGKREGFHTALDRHYPGAGNEVLKRFDDFSAFIRNATYICCFSEHPEFEDTYGRLSMWRAYGSKSGVALVLEVPGPYSAIPLNVYLSPVAYLGQSEFWQYLDEAIGRINAADAELAGISREDFIFNAYRMLVMATLSLKHPAFIEEREWRLIHLPFEAPSQYVKGETATIGGVPQVVFKIPLENHPPEGIEGIAIPDLLDRVIIGPTQYPGPIYRSLAKELSDAGVPNAGEKIKSAGIPLRT